MERVREAQEGGQVRSSRVGGIRTRETREGVGHGRRYRPEQTVGVQKYLGRNTGNTTVTRGIGDWPELRWIPRCLGWTVR